MSSAANRSKLACSACTRRKVRCRRKDPDYRSVVSPEATFSTNAPLRGDLGDAGLQSTRGAASDHSFDECAQPAVLQLLLPSPRQVRQLVDYHDECLLWYHGSYFAPTFRTQLEAFYSRHDGLIDSPGVNLQWVALLFSIISAALACAPPTRSRIWGFRAPEERETLSKRWFQAVAIATSTIAAHLLGFSNSQSIHLAAAVRVAQSLALHRLGPDAPGTTVEKEIGRRVWCQLCSQDWFSIPFSESYLVNPAYSTSEPPSNAHDHDLVPLPLHIPTQTSYCRFLREVAAIMPRLQDGLVACNTAYTRYEQVLSWDGQLRALATSERPIFLSSAPIEPSWPVWTPWARRALAISSSHKIIMIHRSFLSDSFTNPAFAFTRRTCLAASKTIIKEYKCVVVEDGPVLWIHQAFSVAAAIILILDVLHRDPTESEWAEHRDLAEDVLGILASCQNSMIASRGVKLLDALLAEVGKASARSGRDVSRKRARDGSLLPSDGKANKFDVPCFVKTFCEDKSAAVQGKQQQQRPVATALAPRIPSLSDDPPPVYDGGDRRQQQDVLDFAQPDINFSFPPAGLDGANGFENLLYLANHDLFSIF
ncbi:hypothetical protein F5X68DRAFT_270932 [Plectosphaerella plurivora]|uniref:Transcription factor domain-containing protein n=1 Tax=Plectosphaerella plurivora TaxID=936078 RepID=A0A9P8V386_9PEZI|nr:hypothetical protein F5X68DRAFT_270932 [Plectosphaerella plurivora]